ncbi:unnamed protein product, partial [Ilex paraguariensis]
MSISWRPVFTLVNPSPEGVKGCYCYHPRAMMGTSPDSGQLMAMLLTLVNAKGQLKLEFSLATHCFLTALTIRMMARFSLLPIARLPIIKKAGVEHKINFIQSEALPVLDKLLETSDSEGSFDFAFVD